MSLSALKEIQNAAQAYLRVISTNEGNLGLPCGSLVGEGVYLLATLALDRCSGSADEDRVLADIRRRFAEIYRGTAGSIRPLDGLALMEVCLHSAPGSVNDEHHS